MVVKKSINQENAINHGDGPCIVIAGPGSGKTYVITNRIANLITEYDVQAENILVITFTRAAASAMKERFENLTVERNISYKNKPTFGTFHSVFFEILKNDFGYNGQSLVNRNEEVTILSEVLEKNSKLKVSMDLIGNILVDIKNYKNCVERDEYFIPKYLSQKEFSRVYKLYSEKMSYYKKLDFNDMISKCYELLCANKKELSYYQNKYKYILVDEFQDINKLQYDLVKLICKNKNIFVVGDDDQSIYKFRGSHPKVMMDFVKDFKNARVIYLTNNYRSTKQIVGFSKNIIDYNKERYPKEIAASRNEIGRLVIKSFSDSYEENSFVINLIKEHKRYNKKLSDIAILYRTNLLVNSIKLDLKKNCIPYRIKGDELSFYNNFAVKDVISYLRLATGSNNSNDLMNIANKPPRYISRESFRSNSVDIDDLIKYYRNKDYILPKLIRLKQDLKSINHNITALSIRYIRRDMGYDNYLKDHCRKNEIDYEEIEQTLDAFEEESILYKDIEEFLKHIDENDKKKNIVSSNVDAVNLMSFHLSKGLEFDTVFIIDANDGLIPHKKSIRENDLETERRLLYVAITRAKNNLYLLFTIRRFGKDFKPSRFISEAIGGKNE